MWKYDQWLFLILSFLKGGQWRRKLQTLTPWLIFLRGQCCFLLFWEIWEGVLVVYGLSLECCYSLSFEWFWLLLGVFCVCFSLICLRDNTIRWFHGNSVKEDREDCILMIIESICCYFLFDLKSGLSKVEHAPDWTILE